MILVGILGIFIGNLLGIILCMKLVPYILGILGISTGNMTLQFNPVILIVSIVVTIFYSSGNEKADSNCNKGYTSRSCKI